MNTLMNIKNKIIKSFFIVLLIMPINSCGIWDPGDARKIDPSGEVRARKAIEEGRGISLDKALKGRQGGAFQFASSNHLWRATLEVLDFIPLVNVDYAGGLVITDWYAEGTASGESIKLTVRFLSNEIRADAVKIIVHKRVCNKSQRCRTKKISSTLEVELKNSILRVATLMQKKQWDANAERMQKKYWGASSERKK